MKRIKVLFVGIMAMFVFNLTGNIFSEQKKDSLIVHEWGVFTSVQNKKGIVFEKGLKGKAELRYPYFCLTPGSGAHHRDFPVGEKKPVIYFYPSGSMDITVNVNMIDGYLDKWYPSCIQKMKNDNIWTVTLYPQNEKKLQLQEPYQELHKPYRKPINATLWWKILRDTDSAYVRTRGECEKFIFYAGKSDIELPVKVEVSEDQSTMTIVNNDKNDIRILWLIDVKFEKVSVYSLPEVKSNEQKKINISKEFKDYKDYKDALPELHKKLSDQLVQSGLYKKEAEGMVKVWEELLLKTEGMRILYFVPQEYVNSVLSLKINPEPTELKRVFWSWLEIE